VSLGDGKCSFAVSAVLIVFVCMKGSFILILQLLLNTFKIKI